jgi:uncharacterized low-complexity protein
MALVWHEAPAYRAQFRFVHPVTVLGRNDRAGAESRANAVGGRRSSKNGATTKRGATRLWINQRRSEMSNKVVNTLTLAVGSALLGTCMAASAANPFSLNDMSKGYMQVADAPAAAAKPAEGKCGEGKCGSQKNGKAHPEAACGADKMGAAHAGKHDKSAAEGKCGEGKCGGDKKGKEGSCGADKKGKEGSCGGDKH